MRHTFCAIKVAITMKSIVPNWLHVYLKLLCIPGFCTSCDFLNCSHVQAAHAQASAAFQAAQHAQQTQQAQHGQGFVAPPPPPPTNLGVGNASRGPFAAPALNENWNRGKRACWRSFVFCFCDSFQCICSSSSFSAPSSCLLCLLLPVRLLIKY